MIIDDVKRRAWRDAAKEDLSRYRQAQRDIKDMQDKILTLQAKAERISRHPDPDRAAVQTPNPGPEALLIAIADLRSLYGSKQIQAEHVCMEIETRLSRWTDGVQQRILRSFYLFGQTFERIAVAEDYSYRHIARLHGYALENYGRKLMGQDDPS